MAIRTLLYALAYIAVVSATQVMHRPVDYTTLLKPAVHDNITARDGVERLMRERAFVESHMSKRAGGKVSIGYFTNWGIYARNFQPTDIVSSTLTHVLYSFADVDPNSGTISLTDSYADEQKHFPTDSWNDVGNNLYGCLKQMYLLKMKQRNLKVLLSIGGWTYSQAGHFNFITNAAFRSTFVSSAVSMVENLGLDGIDIDFEYPSTPALGSGFASLVTELRTAFDQLAAKKGDTVPYQITLAVSAGAANYANLDMPTMNSAISYWNLMAYDYAGSWSNVSDYLANLYGGQSSGVSTDKAFKDYISRGATASKISMGIPLYGRGFEQTAGIRQSYNGIGPGTWEAGVYDYKALPFAGAAVIEDTVNVASYSYDASKKELISYDTPNIVNIKTHYINTNGMAGSMFWSLDSDKIGADSLIGVSVGILGGLDQTQNHLNYPDSVWANIANNMASTTSVSAAPPASSPPPPASSPPPPASSSPPPASSPPPPASTPPPPASSPPPPASTPASSSAPTSTSSPSVSCAGVAPWSSTVAYNGGQSVTYNGHLWTALWWSQADVPGGPAGDWADKGAC